VIAPAFFILLSARFFSGTKAMQSSAVLKPFIPPPNLKGLFVGSGSDGLNDARMAQAVLDLVTDTDVEKQPTVLYLGTATYDLNGPRERQTEQLKALGCHIKSLDLIHAAPGIVELRDAVESSDIILVSGGNTLFAVDRWKRLGLDNLLQQAMLRGAALAGGSAGAICWFSAGHSDSMDPDTYKTAMLQAAAADSTRTTTKSADESSAAPTSACEAKEWEYIRIPGLNFLPGLVCPHHDKVQSNGVLRAMDFDQMLLRHPEELGIGIDHWAALELNNGRYRVISLEDKEGSVLPDGSFSQDRHGKPGIWIKQVQNGNVVRSLCPESGMISDLLRFPIAIVDDERVEICRQENPDDGPVPA
jgi:dipeptidase E